MDIMKRIALKRADWFAARNSSVGRLLVGQAELKELEEEALSWGIPKLAGPGMVGKYRPEVLGMFLYVMDDESYLAVAP
jgi:hypothetical protein